MLVSVYCKDSGGSAELRQSKLSERRQYVETIEDKIKLVGPIMGPDGKEMVGSLWIFEVDSLDEADEILKADPYYRAGVWQEIDVREFKGVTGSWIGGKTW